MEADLVNDLQALAQFVLPLAEERLRTQRGFFPYGGILSPEGHIHAYSAHGDSEQPRSQLVIDRLTEAFQELGQTGKAKASVIVVDVVVVPPGTETKTDAVLLMLDHAEQGSVELYLPYCISETNHVAFGTMFSTPGKGTMYPTL